MEIYWKKIEEAIEEGDKFSIIVDEWEDIQAAINLELIATVEEVINE